jgi:serralysin
MRGGAGSDVFVLNIADAGGLLSADRILDFKSGEDVIELTGVALAALARGVLKDQQLAVGAGSSRAADSDDRLIFDSNSGALYFDSDGTGSAAPLLLAYLSAQSVGANLNGGFMLRANDFLII